MPLRRIKLTLEYDGSEFFGWQLQAATNERTVQGTLQQALATIPGAVPRIHAAGRTDAGVHALAMIAHYDTSDAIPDAQLARALNARLPADVRVIAAASVDGGFEAQFGCRYRCYEYRMRLARDDLRGAALDRRRVLHLYQNVDAAAMVEAAPHFEGTRDFAALATQETRNTVRTVFLCECTHRGRDLSVVVAADGFLRGMVRAIVGTIILVGEGKLAPAEVTAVLSDRDRNRAGPNAPPHGLYFVKAGYREWPGKP